MCFFLAIPPCFEVQKMNLGAGVPHHPCNEQERDGFKSANAL
jgi:hypothetical protein